MTRSRELLSLLASLPLFVLTGDGVSATPVTPMRNAGGVLICHHAGPTKTIEISVAAPAVPAHVMMHGDNVGPCGSPI
jgi:hypothetical protein